jgi:hypothetical protein
MLCSSDVERGTEQTHSKEQGEEWSYESFQQQKKNNWGPSCIDQENHPISIMVSLCISVAVYNNIIIANLSAIACA